MQGSINVLERGAGAGAAWPAWLVRDANRPRTLAMGRKAAVVLGVQSDDEKALTKLMGGLGRVKRVRCVGGKKGVGLWTGGAGLRSRAIKSHQPSIRTS